MACCEEEIWWTEREVATSCQGETVDQDVLREVHEETCLQTIVRGLNGLRVGVIRGQISDNMAISICRASDKRIITPQLIEIYEALWMSQLDLTQDPHSSVIIHELETIL